MITKFQTTQNASSGAKNGSNMLAIIGILALGGFLVYKFYIVPKQEEEN